MNSMAKLVREQVARAMTNVRQAFRGTAVRNTHGKLIGVELQGLAGESVSGELIQHYGFSSAPLEGAEYVVVPVGGNSKHAVVVASDDGRYRVTLQDGEVSLYTDEGDYIHLKRGRLIEVETETLLVKAKTKIRFETPLVELSKDLKADGQITDAIRSMQGDRELYNAHGHPGGPKPTPQQ